MRKHFLIKNFHKGVLGKKNFNKSIHEISKKMAKKFKAKL